MPFLRGHFVVKWGFPFFRGLALLTALLAFPVSGFATAAKCGQPVMGTILDVTVVAPDQAQAKQLCADAVAEARHWDNVLTTWRANGELARLNARAGAGSVPISSALAAALTRMQTLHRATGGAFDPAVAPLVRRWRGSSAPSAAAAAATGPHRLNQALSLTDGRATLTRGARLDAGGIGKGIALDAIATMLRERGARAAFLDFGGSSQLAIGAPPGTAASWNVVVTGLGAGAVKGFIGLRDAALSTSRALGAAAAAGPIIDPRTGTPVPSPRLVTVLATDATSADAWSTALIVLGRQGLHELAEHGLDGLVEDAQGTEQTRTFPIQR